LHLRLQNKRKKKTMSKQNRRGTNESIWLDA